MPRYLTDSEAAQLNLLIASASRIVITTHKSPDGDAMGSSLALAAMLPKTSTSTVKVVVPDEVPDFLRWLPGTSEVIEFSSDTHKAEEAIAGAQLIFSLDYNSLSRTGAGMEQCLKASGAPFVLIDHHREPAQFARISYSDITCGSTAELIYRLFETMHWMQHVDVPIAECIYTGIMTDSGSFRFPSVTAATHRAVAHLLDIGLDHAAVHRAVYDNNLHTRLQLVGYALSQKLVVMPECATAYISLSAEELKRFDYRPGDTEDLVNEGLSIAGVKLAAFFREGSNEIKVSFRSKSAFDVSQLARTSWNGGGHLNAAGGSSTDTLERVIERFRQQVQSMKDEIVNS